MRLLSLASLVAPLVVAQSLAPVVYWRASPVTVNDSTLFAGSFGTSPSVFVCGTPSGNCTEWNPVPVLDAWEQGIKFSMPVCPATGCRFQICSEPGNCIAVADPNSPDIWFAMAHPPLPGTTFSPLPTGGSVLVNAPGAAARSVLRVFGRSLAFTPGSFGAPQCVPATQRQDASATVLTLSASGPSIPASNATCFEATFDLETALGAAGGGPFPDAVVATPFGTFPVPLVIAPARPSSALTTIDVDADAGGNVSAALAQVCNVCNALPYHCEALSFSLLQAAAILGDKRVVLGAHAYALSTPLVVPNRTMLAGAAADASALVFTLAGTAAPDAVITGAGSDWGLRSLSIVLLEAPAKTPAVRMHAATSNFSALGVNITMLQVRGH